MASGISYGWQVENSSGTPVSGALIAFKLKGTSTNATTYTDSALTIPAPNPVVADAAGWFQVYLNPNVNYDVTIKSADSSITYQSSSISPSDTGSQPLDATLTALAGAGFENRKVPQGTGVDTVANRLPEDLVIQPDGYSSTVDLGAVVGQYLNLASFSPAANGTTDDATVFATFIDALQTRKVKGYVNQEIAISFVSKTALTEDLDITFGPQARIIGLPTKQVFAGDDAITSLVVTVWTKNGSFRVVHINALGVEDLLTEGTDYSVSGQTINLAGGSSPFGALPTGESIRVADSSPMFELRANSRNLCALTLTGGYFDSSARGYAPATSSGTIMGVRLFNRVSISKGYYYASDTYVDALDEGVGDAAIASIDCSNMSITENTFQGFPDIAFYGSGNSDSGIEDDGYGHFVSRNRFIYCADGVSVKRYGQAVSVVNNVFEYCQNGVSLLPTSDNIFGGEGIIANNNFFRMVRRAIDVRRTDGVIVHDNKVIDFGLDIDASTPTTLSTPAGIVLLGCSNSKVHDNIIELRDYAKGVQKGIFAGADSVFTTRQCVNVDIQNNKIVGVAGGIEESGSGTGVIWNNNEIIGTDTPVTVISGRRWNYRISNQTFDGIGSAAFEGSFTPAVTFSTTAGTITHSVQNGRYRRQGNRVLVAGRVDFQKSGGSAGQLRITGLPYTSVNATDILYAGQFIQIGAGSSMALTRPANTIDLVPVVILNVSYIRVHAMLSTGGITIIAASDIADSTTLRLDFTVEYECAQEAVN